MQITTYSAFLDYLLDAGISPASPGELEDFFGFPVSILGMKDRFNASLAEFNANGIKLIHQYTHNGS